VSPLPETPAEVEVNFPDHATGERLRLYVKGLAAAPPCKRDGAKTISASLSSFLLCSGSTVGEFPAFYVFDISLDNLTEEALTIRLTDFVMIAANSGDSYPPINLIGRITLEAPNSLFPAQGIVPAGGSISGWVTFAPPSPPVAFEPQRVSYVDDDQVLSVNVLP
jgi:hypothetical protein